MSRKDAVIGPGRIALVSGGSSGIGLAVARELARAGCQVWLVARHEGRLAAALDQVNAARQSEDQRCGALRADVSDPAQAFTAVEQVVGQVGAPHLLVNAAGVARPGYIHQVDLQDYRWMMETNFFGTLHMVKAVLPGMLRRRSGHIVNISSVGGFLGVFGYSAYGASKFAVSGFTEVLRAELKPYGVGVSIVFPPDVDTPQLAYELQFRPPETRAIVEGPRVLSPEEVAAAILRGVSRRKYAILPDLLTKALYGFIAGPTSLAHPVVDWLAARGRRIPGENE